jgi:hypothetical protein
MPCIPATGGVLACYLVRYEGRYSAWITSADPGDRSQAYGMPSEAAGRAFVDAWQTTNLLHTPWDERIVTIFLLSPDTRNGVLAGRLGGTKYGTVGSEIAPLPFPDTLLSEAAHWFLPCLFGQINRVQLLRVRNRPLDRRDHPEEFRDAWTARPSPRWKAWSVCPTRRINLWVTPARRITTRR